MRKTEKILVKGILISGVAMLASFGIQKANAEINAEALVEEALTVNGVTLIPNGGGIEIPEFVPGQILVKFKPEIEISPDAIPDWLKELGVISVDVIFPGAPSPKETKLKKIRELVETRKALVRKYTQDIKINKFSLEKLLEFLERLRYLNEALNRIARAKPEKEFVDLRNSWKLVFKEDIDILDMIKKLKADEHPENAEEISIKFTKLAEWMP